MNSMNAAIPLKRNKQRVKWFPIVALLSSLGLFITAIGDYLAREVNPAGSAVFWFGLTLLIVPIVFRLTDVEVSRRERIALVVVVGLFLYFVKILQSPFGFTFTDEYVHSFNVAQIVSSGTLFIQNPILPATPYFPGLEIVTAALVSISGLSIFTAGLIVIGVVRLILILSLFFFYEYIGHSEWVAGIAAILYACNPNFVFWSGQFSYESLALPLAFLVLFIIARRDKSVNLAEYRGFTFAATLVIIAVVITHHISSYFLAVFLLAWGLLTLLFPREIAAYRYANSPGQPERSMPNFKRLKGPVGLSILAILLATGWLFLTAQTTIAYFAPVFGKAAQSILNISTGLQAPRSLFGSSSPNPIPVWQRLIAYASVILMALGIPWGLRTYWSRYRASGIIFLLALMGVVYFGILILRLSPASWEIANRASEYFFLGLAFLLATGALGMTGPSWAPWLRKVIVTVAITIIFLGGVISGWTPGLTLQQPSLVKVGNALIVPQGQAVAQWFLSEFGPGNRVGADPTSARLMLTYGDQFAYSGSTPDIQDILNTPTFAQWQLQELQRYSIPYLVVDERPVTHNVIAAGSFDPLNQPAPSSPVDAKFSNTTGVSEILDSGNIRIFAVGTVLAK